MNRLIRRAYGSIIKIGAYNCLEVLRFIPSDISRPIIINKDKEYSKLLDTMLQSTVWTLYHPHGIKYVTTSSSTLTVGEHDQIVLYRSCNLFENIGNSNHFQPFFFTKLFTNINLCPMSSTWEYFIYDVMPFVQLCKTHHGSTIY